MLPILFRLLPVRPALGAMVIARFAWRQTFQAFLLPGVRVAWRDGQRLVLTP